MTLPELERYAVQARVEQIGSEGQARLADRCAVVVGVGALGSSIAHQLVRGGVGRVRLVDGDVPETGNLHRQILYTEDDVRSGRPKAVLAAEHLRAANSAVEVEARAERLREDNVDGLLEGADVIVDGTDNLATRYLINEYAVSRGVPWIYGGIAGVHGLVLPVLPGRGPCLRCLFPEGPPEREEPTSETYGVFGPTPATVGALEAAQAMRLLAGSPPEAPRLLSVDVWSLRVESLVVRRLPECPTCGNL